MISQALEVDLQKLREKYGAEYKSVGAADAASGEIVQPGRGPCCLGSPTGRRSRTYLKLLLSREVGLNYTAVGEE